MRTVQLRNSRIIVSDDPLELIRITLGFAMSPPLRDEIDERLAPDTGEGFHLDGVFTLYHARTRDELPEKFWEDPPFDPEREEVWVMSRDTRGMGSEYGLIEGNELRRLVADLKRIYASLG